MDSITKVPPAEWVERLVEVICEMDGNARKDADAIFRLAQRDINAAIERDNLRAQIAAAKVVAARLVEVICEQERRDSWPELVAKTRAATRAQIAADIEAMMSGPHIDPERGARCGACVAEDAARIARGET